MTPKENKNFVDHAVLAQTAHEVAALADAAGVRACLVGGFAMQLYGSPRLTGDLDFAAEDFLFQAQEMLSFGGERVAINGVEVDIIVRDDDVAGLYQECVEASVAVKDENGPTIVRCATAPYLAAMKMEASRTKDDADLEFLILKDLDVPATKAIIKRHLGVYAAKEFQLRVDEVKWKASRGR